MEYNEEENCANKMIQPMTKLETTQFLNFYMDLFLSSPEKYTNGVRDEDLIARVQKISCDDNRIDPKCLFKLDKKLVRIEYPGDVKNIDKAIATLGGMKNIECSVGRQKRKLELNFHPNNRFCKACVADKNTKPGILIKVKTKSLVQPSSSTENPHLEYDYDVIGLSVLNFTFNRLSDFQYLPLVPQDERETKESKTNFIYDKILPSEIPDREWLTKEESKTMEPFLLPVRFARYDYAHGKLLIDHSDKIEDSDNTEAATQKDLVKKRKVRKIFGKMTKHTTSIFMNFKDKEIPKEPPESAKKSMQKRFLERQLARVAQLFEERPIWTKAAVIYNTGITTDQAKVILPMIAYYYTNGPWRVSWVKYGYDPRLDPKSRIYQTLDYRIRAQDSIKMKILAKNYAKAKNTATAGPVQVKKVSLNDEIATKSIQKLDEKCYVLRPATIPPARQMFYQLCDLLIPEIQDRISRLDRETAIHCDHRTGWLPKDFMTECREIANKCVLEAVQKEFFKDKRLEEEESIKQGTVKSNEGGVTTTTLDYCHQMLDNIKKGIYKNLPGPSVAGSSGRYPNETIGDDVELISLSDDDDDDDFNDLLPELLLEQDDADDDITDDDASEFEDEGGDIDMETVDEINKMLSEPR